ncbi:hypothetical protein [Kribbella sp. NPDC049584]|uniref:hypothetical protein n=1 Tax=Kribbella sp. NPDC049584 TaxID=3154833 RepID=UPI00342BE19D
MPTPSYQGDPEALPDGAFEPGALRHLVPGNRGRLLDSRRTPVVLRAVRIEPGMFELEVTAFEDIGARWLLPFEDITRLQFELDAETATSDAVAAYERAVERLDRPLTIPADRSARRATLRAIAAERERAAVWLDRRLPAGVPDLPALVERGEGDERLYEAVESLMTERGLSELEGRFADRYVSNPFSGELVKGHRIVLAELGLATHYGTIVRDPGLFDGVWSRERRRDHLVTRLAFVQALLARAGNPTVTLYRGMAWDGRSTRRRPHSLISATFSRALAEEHFGGGSMTTSAALYRQEVPAERVLMTFIETRAMNRQYKEAEAIVLGAKAGDLF